MKWQRIRFYSNVSILYVLTLLFVVILLRPRAPQHTVLAYAPTLPVAAHILPARQIISGRPNRIVVRQESNGLNLDLPVIDGAYNEATAEWTLSKTNAHFALPSMEPNDYQGSSLIYGHDTVQVFNLLSALKPGMGAYAEVYTTNGHIMRYTYQDYSIHAPEDVSIFRTDGPPTLLLQKCGGTFSEYRQLFRFTLQKVDGQDV